jgi:hypothetical protein
MLTLVMSFQVTTPRGLLQSFTTSLRTHLRRRREIDGEIDEGQAYQ